MIASNGLEQLAFSRLGFDDVPDDELEESDIAMAQDAAVQVRKMTFFHSPTFCWQSLLDPGIVFGATIVLAGIVSILLLSQPSWIARLMLPLGTVLFIARAYKLYHRSDAACIRCGQDLIANTSSSCPSCGLGLVEVK